MWEEEFSIMVASSFSSIMGTQHQQQPNRTGSTHRYNSRTLRPEVMQCSSLCLSVMLGSESSLIAVFTVCHSFRVP